jgi:phenylpropionate dioxygenase-like ring-hydroxylating dioxygenase large terminal subunit
MSKTGDRAALDNWYVIGRPDDVSAGQPRQTRLLGQDLIISKEDGGISVREIDHAGAAAHLLPVRVSYGHIWTTLGEPARDLFGIPEFAESDRSLAACGAVRVKTSGLRLVENFMDMAHFPFVHTDVLGTESAPEVGHYDCEIRKEIDEVWATNCKFWRPGRATGSPGQMASYTYRVPAPFNVILYKVCPAWPDRLDLIALFVQPVEEDLSLAYAVVLMLNTRATVTEIIRFQQTIFLQDRIILENQRPRRMPLSPKAEIPTRADISSVVYRRWIKEKGLRFGIEERTVE